MQRILYRKKEDVTQPTTKSIVAPLAILSAPQTVSRYNDIGTEIVIQCEQEFQFVHLAVRVPEKSSARSTRDEISMSAYASMNIVFRLIIFMT
jgi:hypothetical protein